MAIASRQMLWRVLIGCLLIGCLHTTIVARAEEVAAEDSEVAAPTEAAPPLPLGEVVMKGMVMLKATDNFRRQKEAGDGGMKRDELSEVYKHYQEAFSLMTAALEADSEWDFKDEKESSDHHREKLIFNIVKSLERKGALTQRRTRALAAPRCPDALTVVPARTQARSTPVSTSSGGAAT